MIDFIFNSWNQNIIWCCYWQEFSVQYSKKSKPAANTPLSSSVGDVKDGLPVGPSVLRTVTASDSDKAWTSPCVWEERPVRLPDRLADEECFLIEFAALKCFFCYSPRSWRSCVQKLKSTFPSGSLVLSAGQRPCLPGFPSEILWFSASLSLLSFMTIGYPIKLFYASLCSDHLPLWKPSEPLKNITSVQHIESASQSFGEKRTVYKFDLWAVFEWEIEPSFQYIKLIWIWWWAQQGLFPITFHFL